MRGRHIAEKSFSFFGKRSKRKLGRALLCLPHATPWGFREPSRGSRPRLKWHRSRNWNPHNIPIKRDSARMIEAMKKIIDSFNGQIVKHNDEMLSNQSAQAKRLGTLHEVVSNIEMKIITKERLKKNFMLIMNSYIRKRERMGMMTSGKEKEEMAEQARKQIELL